MRTTSTSASDPGATEPRERRPRPTHGVLSEDRDAAVCERCEIAGTPPARLRGLLGRRGLAPGDGLLLESCGSIHTLFMRFPIDAVFLDAERRVLRVRAGLRPWRLAGARGARSVLELAAGEAERRGVRVGERLRLTVAAMPPLDVSQSGSAARGAAR